MRLALAASAALAAFALHAAPALAQSGEPILSAQGSLNGCDPARGDHRVRLEAGRRYYLRAASEDFDTVLRLYRSGEGEVVQENDDSEGGTNSRIAYAPAESGDYCLQVSAFGGSGSAGNYTVTAELAPPLPEARSRPTRTVRATRRIYEGDLGGGAGEDGGSEHDYAITLRAGEAVLISAESEAFDPVVRVYRADDRGGEPIATDDDSGAGFNALLAFAPEEAGDYVVRVASFSTDRGGAYTLRITE
jgi:hypothetical protein